ncbi:hypothetical protein C8A01DRAFT_35279 [Parachaetomium inaequale]|uniref:Uncharacterized protein n=1 Tax=Parachaetomium inaequale TaxID=2588326 RepID=A0AAN6PLI7_9PEZI|nr:hypothetical protein C8A01DRAFT_35279 [Parachaetomium inaequale]
MNRAHVLLAVDDLRFWLNSLHKAAVHWESTTTILTIDLLDKISGLGVDREEILRERIKVLEKKLAALRDLSNALDWVLSSDRAVHAAPASGDVPDITDLEARVKDEGMPEGELRGIWSRVLDMAVVVSEKASLLRDEVRKVEAVAESLEDLDWEPDEAPLTVMLRFS